MKSRTVTTHVIGLNKLHNQALKFVAAYGLHRTSLTGHRLASRYTQGVVAQNGKES